MGGSENADMYNRGEGAKGNDVIYIMNWNELWSHVTRLEFKALFRREEEKTEYFSPNSEDERTFFSQFSLQIHSFGFSKLLWRQNAALRPPLSLSFCLQSLKSLFSFELFFQRTRRRNKWNKGVREKDKEERGEERWKDREKGNVRTKNGMRNNERFPFLGVLGVR